MRRLITSLTGSAFLIGMLAGPTLAADPPTNDLFEAATVVTSIPFAESLDTTGATTDATDAAANANCFAPATEASVWYSLTEPADGGTSYVVNVTGSSYSAGVIVVSGTPDSFALQACGPGSVGFFAVPGTTYSILAFGDTPGVNGGQLAITINVDTGPPQLSVSVDPTATVDRAGHVTLTGTVTCSSPTLVFIAGDVRQRAGRQYVNGMIGGEVWCEDVATWTARTFMEDGVFVGGNATTRVTAFAGALSFAQTEATLRLRPAR
jgi:hypothetical protein